jgi:hypothetical protein
MDGYRIIDVNGVDLCVDTAGDAADPAILLIGGCGQLDGLVGVGVLSAAGGGRAICHPL